MIPKQKLKYRVKKIDMVSARIELAPSSPKSGIVIFLLKTHVTWYLVLFFAARTTHRTHVHSRTAEEREAVMTDYGPQPPIKQLAIAVQ